jgi:hypothetical protein
MKPIEFITESVTHYNTPAGDIAEALSVPIQIYSSPTRQWEILFYYYNSVKKCMVLDIQPLRNSNVNRS